MRISYANVSDGILAPLLDAHVQSLRALGHTVAPLPAAGSVSAVGDLLFSLNFVPDLARLAKRLHRPYVAWLTSAWVNPALDAPDCVSPYAILLHFSRSAWMRTRQLGYRNSFFLPRAIPLSPLSSGVAASPEYPLAFVGNCYTPGECHWFPYLQACRAQALRCDAGLAALARCVEQAVKDWRMPIEMLVKRELCLLGAEWGRQIPLPPGLATDSVDTAAGILANAVLGHEIDRRVRQAMVRALGPYGLHVWGGAEGWAGVEGVASLHAPVARGEGVTAILSRAAVGVNIPRRYTDGVIFRHYEIPAAGGLLLALRDPDAETLFEPDREAVYFDDADEMCSKVAYYIRHDQPRRRIAEAGWRRVHASHTIAHRVAALRALLREIGVAL